MATDGPWKKQVYQMCVKKNLRLLESCCNPLQNVPIWAVVTYRSIYQLSMTNGLLRHTKSINTTPRAPTALLSKAARYLASMRFCLRRRSSSSYAPTSVLETFSSTAFLAPTSSVFGRFDADPPSPPLPPAAQEVVAAAAGGMAAAAGGMTTASRAGGATITASGGEGGGTAPPGGGCQR